MNKHEVEASLQAKIKLFEKTLTSHEVIRLAQLRSTDAEGNLLEGQASLDEARRRIVGHPHLSNDFKYSVQASLDSKLKEFQGQLTDAELAKLICQLSTKPFKAQSSYGACD